MAKQSKSDQPWVFRRKLFFHADPFELSFSDSLFADDLVEVLLAQKFVTEFPGEHVCDIQGGNRLSEGHHPNVSPRSGFRDHVK